MKIALLGNMNNNNFALMRYFRELGEDAHLFLYSSDGVGTLSHFRPEDDTWTFDKWSPYIHYLNFEESYRSLILNPFDKNLKENKKIAINELKQYDVLIGSGLTPSILRSCGLRLDVFFPYSIGIEYIGYKPKGWWAKNLLYKWIERYQTQAIKDARFRFNAEMGYTKAVFNGLSLTFYPLAIPMYFNGEEATSESKDSNKAIMDRISKSELSILSHSRQMWVQNKKAFSDSEWRIHSKNSDWLILGFAEYIKETNINASLFLIEYGPDVMASKKLILDLGISDHVIWLPKMSRKQIVGILSKCDIGVGEFMQGDGVIWGGTGWEILANGKPLMQSYNFTPKSYYETFGHEGPPILDIKSAKDVYNNLRKYNKSELKAIGLESKKWFDTYNGISLANKWLETINNG